MRLKEFGMHGCCFEWPKEAFSVYNEKFVPLPCIFLLTKSRNEFGFC